jgi:Mlc titration factor MtfA (ptsG expression regulator)
MTLLIIAALIAGSTGCLIVMILVIKRSKRNKLRATPAPDAWRTILEKTFPTFGKMTPPQQTQLFCHMQEFLAEKHFEGCGGQEITEEIKVTVAAQACILLLGRNSTVYPKLKSVLIYPHTYTSGQKGVFGGDNGESSRLGESWDCGVVVLSWNSVLGGARNMEDGHNVTFHEFAHQLDQEDGAADGAPILEERSAYSAWARVFSREYSRLVDKTEHGKKSTIDSYGATNPAEFFAVATETFFEKPRQLMTRHPELYDELKTYYKTDPIEWI